MQQNTYDAAEGKLDASEATAPAHKITGKELFRSTWHAFPGFLTLWLLFTFFADKPLRTWWVRLFFAISQRIGDFAGY